MLILAAHYWGPCTIPISPAWASRALIHLHRLPPPHVYTQGRDLGKLFGIVYIIQEHVWLSPPRMPFPLQKPHTSSPNLNTSFWREPVQLHQSKLTPSSPTLHCLYIAYVALAPSGLWYRQKHTGHSLLNGNFPRRTDSLLFDSDLSFSIPKCQGQKILNIYVSWTELLTGYKNFSCFPLGHAQLPTIIHIP